MILPYQFSNAIKATIDLMDASSDVLSVRSSYNVSAISFSPEQIYSSIQLHFPDFEIEYAPDYREKIAESWPNSINDDVARDDWNWSPAFDLEKMTENILSHLPKLLEEA